MEIGLLLIGDEILNGAREDLNAHLVIKKLQEKQQTLNVMVVAQDNEQKIAESIRFLLKNNDLIITSGGLGLTPDDVTINAIAIGLNKKVIICNKAKEAVEKSLKRLGKKINGNLAKDFSHCIEGSEVIDNEVGVAPIERIMLNNKLIYILPGVPKEFSIMFQRYVLKEIPEGKSIREISVDVSCSESDIVDILRELEKRFGVKTASYPPIFEKSNLNIKLKGKDIETAFKFFLNKLRDRGIKFETNISR